MYILYLPFFVSENAGPEIDGPKKNNRLKMSHMKMTDQNTRHEIAGQKNAKTKTVMDSRQLIYVNYVQCTKHTEKSKSCSSYS